MSPRRRWLALLLALLGLLALGLVRLPVWSAHLVARDLGTFFHRPVTTGEVRYRLFPLEAEIRDLRVGGATPEDPPFLEARRIVALPRLRPLWERRVVFSTFRVQGLKVRINAFRQGGDDIPKMGGAGSWGAEVRIGRLLIEEGEFILNHQRVPLEMDLPDFRGELRGGRGRALAGRVSFAPGRLRFGSNPQLPLSTDIELEVDGPRITVASGRLRSDGIDIAYRGRLDLSPRPRGEFGVSGPVDLGVLDRHVMRTGFGIGGAGRYQGTVTVDGSRLRLRGRLEGEGGVFDGVPVPRYAGELAWDEKGVHLRGLEVATLGGAATFDVEVPPGPSTARLTARLEGVDAEKAVMAVFDIGAAGLGSEATGTVAIQWPRGRIRRLTGRIALDLLPGADGRTPVSGRFEWRAESGVQFVEKADLRTPHTRVRLEGRIEPDDRTDLAVDGESTDLEAMDELGKRLRQALGTRDAQLASVSGSGSFHGRWKGTLQVPVFEGRFSGQDVAYLGVVWGKAEWAGALDPFEARSRSLVLKRPGGELWIDGRTETGFYGEQDRLDVRVRLKDWPAADIIRAFDWDLDLQGPLSGEASVKGRRSVPGGSGRITASAGRYYGVPFSDLQVDFEVREGVTQATAGRARVGGGALRFSGTLTDEGSYDGIAEFQDVEAEEVLPAPGPRTAWGGKLDGKAVFQGTLEKPRIEARLSSPRLFLGDEGVGAVEARLTGQGDGVVAVAARSASARTDMAIQGTVGAEAPYPASLRITARETSLDPFLRALFEDLPAGAIVASGELEVRGPLASPRDLGAEATVSDLQALLPEYPVRNRRPLRLSVEKGRMHVRDLHLAGEGTDLVVEGSAALEEEGALGFTLRGAADLRALTALNRRLRGRGAARLSMAVLGTRRAPRFEGTLELEGAGLRLRGFPHGLEEVRGSVRFTEQAAQFAGVTGTLGGGTVELEGQVSYSGPASSFDVRGVGHGLTLRYPEGLRSVIDADLRLVGDEARPWVSGTVDVRQALWTRRYDLATELLAARTEREPGASLEAGVRLDVKLRAPGTLRIDNNITTLQARADLKLQGTSEAPVVLGRAEIDRGRVYFQGNTYVIRRGTIDFANPQKVDPLFDIEAESRIRAWRVTLKMNGTLERVYPTLTADPPLTAVQILNLIAGADESTVTALSASPTGREKLATAGRDLAAAGAATLAAGKLSEDLGLERGAQRLFGLNRFSIDPSVVTEDVGSSGARLTVGKRIKSDVNVLYSTNLRGTQERLLSVEYTLSDRLSLLLTRAEPGGMGFDLRVRRTHR